MAPYRFPNREASPGRAAAASRRRDARRRDSSQGIVFLYGAIFGSLLVYAIVFASDPGGFLPLLAPLELLGIGLLVVALRVRNR